MTPLEWCALRDSWDGGGGARRAAARMNKGKAKGRALVAFRCFDCGRWHIGREGSSAGSLRGKRPAWGGGS